MTGNMESMDIRDSMRSFTTHDLNKQVGDVTDAAAKAPVIITRHRKPRFVMMSYEHYQRIRETADPRRGVWRRRDAARYRRSVRRRARSIR
jgi:prevent-host-death family protein